MDFSKLPGKIFLDNKFIKSKDAKIHVLNHSLHFATSIFEGIGVYAGKPLFLKEHYKRLLMSAKIMGLKIESSLCKGLFIFGAKYLGRFSIRFYDR